MAKLDEGKIRKENIQYFADMSYIDVSIITKKILSKSGKFLPDYTASQPKIYLYRNGSKNHKCQFPTQYLN